MLLKNVLISKHVYASKEHSRVLLRLQLLYNQVFKLLKKATLHLNLPIKQGSLLYKFIQLL